MKPQIIPIHATSKEGSGFNLTYSAKVPEWVIGKTVLIYPPQEILKKHLLMANIGPIDITDKWVHVRYEKIITGVSIGNVKSFNVGDIVANLVVFEEEVEDYNQEDYDE